MASSSSLDELGDDFFDGTMSTVLRSIDDNIGIGRWNHSDGTFCSVRWNDLWTDYNDHVHYPLLLFICTLGCVTNVLNLFIFTRSAMRNPTNLLLTVLAAADFLCVFRKAVGTTLIIIYRGGIYQRTSYRIHLEDLINEICFYVFHTWSIYMTVVVALWRLIYILRPLQSRYWFSYKSAVLVVATVVGFATLLVPMLFVGTTIELYNLEPQYDVNYQSLNSSTTEPLSDEQIYVEDESYIDDDPDYVLTQTDFGLSLHFWIHGLLIKLIPCCILLLSTILLIMSLRAATKSRSALFGNRNVKTTTAPAASSHIPDEDAIRDFTKQTMPGYTGCATVSVQTRNTSKPSSTPREFTKTTKMLIILLVIFLVTELPPGVLAFSFGLIKSKKFFVQCYKPVKPFLNLNEYISSSVGLFIYLSMSSKFRQTFAESFWKNKRRNESTSDENRKRRKPVVGADL